jgi:phytoene dehydrogenase-like protein
MKEDREYLAKVILPWVFKYALTVRKINAINVPVEDFLRRYTQNQSLVDIIAQHFFRATPAFFALSYLTLYLDYHYPRGGTGTLVDKLVAFIERHGGTIRTSTEIVALDPDQQLVVDAQGGTHEYGRLIWAADQKALYRLVDLDGLADAQVRSAARERRELIADKAGNDSVLTVFLALDLDKGHFASRASEHFFYTPSRTGQSAAGPIPTGEDREAVEAWLKRFFALTTYEISCPVLRDSALAPQGKTGLILSVLFDYTLTKHVQDTGWYDAFKSFAETCMIDTLDGSIYPGIKDAVLFTSTSTPVTMARIAGTADGAITGWAFTNALMPAESRLPRILNAIKTPLPGVLQAGQWTYSPSGLPISILTGKLAADRAIKELSKAQKGR